MVILHGTDAIPVADYLARFNYPVVVGPSMSSRSKPELLGKTFATAGVLAKAGVKVCICSDHDVTPMYFLTTYVGLAVQHGMDELEALKAVTRNPAEVLGIQDRKGDLKVGLDADIVLWDGNPLDYNTRTRQVYIQGTAQM